MTTRHLRKSIFRSRLRLGFLLIALSCFALLPMARAQLPSPSPEGGYPGNNTAEGDGALQNVTPDVSNGHGTDNTATGFKALFSNTTGAANTASGALALLNNTTGMFNTAEGANALFNNNGSQNTANGFKALFANGTGSNNTASGFEALGSNQSGNLNTATGFDALLKNTTGTKTARPVFPRSLPTALATPTRPTEMGR